jgi:hypothetical protein
MSAFIYDYVSDDEFALSDGTSVRSLETEFRLQLKAGASPRDAFNAFWASKAKVVAAEIDAAERSLISDKEAIQAALPRLQPGADTLVLPRRLAGANGVGLRGDIGKWMRSQKYAYRVEWVYLNYYLTSNRSQGYLYAPVLIAEPNVLFAFKLKWF